MGLAGFTLYGNFNLHTSWFGKIQMEAKRVPFYKGCHFCGSTFNKK